MLDPWRPPKRRACLTGPCTCGSSHKWRQRIHMIPFEWIQPCPRFSLLSNFSDMKANKFTFLLKATWVWFLLPATKRLQINNFSCRQHSSYPVLLLWDTWSMSSNYYISAHFLCGSLSHDHVLTAWNGEQGSPCYLQGVALFASLFPSTQGWILQPSLRLPALLFSLTMQVTP